MNKTSPFVAAVVTSQYNAKNHDLATKALRSMVAVGVPKCILQFDTKDSDAERNANLAVAAINTSLLGAGMVIETQAVDDYSTARRWRHGLQWAFQDPTISAALVFPGDLRSELSEGKTRTLRRMVTETDENTLYLADYDTDDQFKDNFDRLIAHETLLLTYPEEAKLALELKLSKLRTEIFVVGRRVYAAMRRNPFEGWGTDPTPQLVINTLRHREFSIKTAHLGKLGDDDNTRRAVGQVQQITRFVAQMLINRIVREGGTAKTEEEQLAAYHRLRDLVEAAGAITLRALDENHRRITAQNPL